MVTFSLPGIWRATFFENDAAYPLPGVFGLFIAPITESVARVALSGSDSNHLSKI
jgi:hypothetical protein